ncbi:MAG: hypothetical protein JOY61_01265 [Chloroflexi bacterium]|nr:hypothetical protein [Chloroflexota bacterium]
MIEGELIVGAFLHDQVTVVAGDDRGDAVAGDDRGDGDDLGVSRRGVWISKYSTRPGIMLEPDLITVDLHQFLAALESATRARAVSHPTQASNEEMHALVAVLLSGPVLSALVVLRAGGRGRHAW